MEKVNSIQSVYIHIPFCNKICSYCDFCKNYYDEKIASDYLNALEKEILSQYKGDLIKTLYIGGGTPSCLSIKLLKKLFSILRIIKLDENCEFTFECNFEDIDDELLKLLKDNKVNRLSIGVQTFNKKFQKLLNRKIDKNEAKRKIKLSKKYFNNINVDLIYALPGEDKEDVINDLEEILKLDINHVSIYALIIEEHTMLYINKVKELSDDVQNKMYYLIKNTLEKKGYINYEISNFCKMGFESKHNLTYWLNNNYYGFGVGASGFIGNVRYENTKSIYDYLDGNTVSNKDILSFNQMMKDEVMLNLRIINGIDLVRFKRKYNKDFYEVFEVENIIKQGLLIKENESLFIPNDKLFVSNEIILMILDNFKLE